MTHSESQEGFESEITFEMLHDQILRAKEQLDSLEHALKYQGERFQKAEAKKDLSRLLDELDLSFKTFQIDH